METAQGVQKSRIGYPLNTLEQAAQLSDGLKDSVASETDNVLLQDLLDGRAPQDGVSDAWMEQLQNRESLAILKKKINLGEVSTKISFQQQRKHIAGTPQFKQYRADRIAKGGTPQSILTLSQEDAQDIIDRFSGMGIVKIIKTGESSFKITEFVTTDRIVGSYFENDQLKETRRVCIYYGKKGVHIVPVKEDYHG